MGCLGLAPICQALSAPLSEEEDRRAQEQAMQFLRKKKDYYGLLGSNRRATLEELQEAIERTLAQYDPEDLEHPPGISFSADQSAAYQESVLARVRLHVEKAQHFFQRADIKELYDHNLPDLPARGAPFWTLSHAFGRAYLRAHTYYELLALGQLSQAHPAPITPESDPDLLQAAAQQCLAHQELLASLWTLEESGRLHASLEDALDLLDNAADKATYDQGLAKLQAEERTGQLGAITSKELFAFFGLKEAEEVLAPSWALSTRDQYLQLAQLEIQRKQKASKEKEERMNSKEDARLRRFHTQHTQANEALQAGRKKRTQEQASARKQHKKDSKHGKAPTDPATQLGWRRLILSEERRLGEEIPRQAGEDLRHTALKKRRAQQEQKAIDQQQAFSCADRRRKKQAAQRAKNKQAVAQALRERLKRRAAYKAQQQKSQEETQKPLPEQKEEAQPAAQATPSSPRQRPLLAAAGFVFLLTVGCIITYFLYEEEEEEYEGQAALDPDENKGLRS